jgi:hypothetical protein
MRKLSTLLAAASVSTSAMAHQVHGPIDNLFHTLSAWHHGSPLLTFGILAGVVSLFVAQKLIRRK